MASRVNTKFVTILVLAIAAAAIIILGLGYMQMRGNPARAMERGEAAFAAGEFREAKDQFGRAVYKDRSNPLYLDRMEAALLKIEPETSADAQELYTEWLHLLEQRARNNQSDIDAQLGYVEEVHRTARQANRLDWWDLLATASQDMLDRMPEAHPRRVEAKTYLSMAKLRGARTEMQDVLDKAIADVKEVVAAQPDNDLAWATLAMGEMALAERSKEQHRSATEVEQQIQKVRDTIKSAGEAVPEGQEVNRIILLSMGFLNSFTPDAYSKAELAAQAEKLGEILKRNGTSWNVQDSYELVGAQPLTDRLDRAIAILDTFVKQHPEDRDKLLYKAGLCYQANRLDEGQTAAETVLNAPRLTVSSIGQFQFIMKQRAAGLLIDIEQKRWTQAPPEQREAMIRKLETYREQLAQLVTDKQNDPLIVRADAKIAFSKGDYQTAVNRFEKIIAEGSEADVEIYLFSAECLERTNQIGMAYERLAGALRSLPNNEYLLVEKARLEGQMGRLDHAKATLELIPEASFAQNDRARLVRDEVERRSSGVGATASPVSAAIMNAVQAAQAGDFETARATLQAELDRSPKDLQLLEAMVHNEIRAGQSDKAREYLKKLEELAPGTTGVKALQAYLQNPDPIESMKAFLAGTQPNEGERSVAVLTNLGLIETQQMAIAAVREQEASRATDPSKAAALKADAAKARDLAARAKQEAVGMLEEARRLTPDHPALIEYEFRRALIDSDWPQAEQAIDRARATNSDQAQGRLYRGRYQLQREQFAEAARTLESVVDQLRYSAVAWRALGYAYVKLNNLADAEKAYTEAYRCNPNDANVVREYLGVLLAGNQPEKLRLALQIAQIASRLAERDTELRELWLTLEGNVGDPARALQIRRDIYNQMPQEKDRVAKADRDNAMRLAQFLAEHSPTLETMIDAKGQPVYSLSKWELFSPQEKEQHLTKARQDWNAECDAILDRITALSENADDLGLIMVRARVLRTRGDVVGGETLLTDYIAAHRPDVTSMMLLALAQYQADANHYVQAIATLEEARTKQSDQKEADAALAQLYLMVNDPVKALPLLESVAKAQPSREAEHQVIECLAKAGKIEDAQARLKKVIDAGQANEVTTMLMASITSTQATELRDRGDRAGAERKYAEVIDILKRAAEQAPDSPLPHQLTADALLRKYAMSGSPSDLDDAMRALDEAEKRRPGLADTSLLRVAVFRERNDTRRIVGELQRLLDRLPNHVSARRQLVEEFLRERNVDAAIQVLKDGIASNPTIPTWHEALGDAYAQVKRDPKQALQSYLKAYELGRSPVVLARVGEAMLAPPDPDYAGVIARMEERPDDVKNSPTLMEIYARALAGVDRREEALQQLRDAYASYRRMIDVEKSVKPEALSQWFTTVARVFRDQVPQGEEFVLQQVGNDPDVHALRFLAQLWLNAGASGHSRAIELQRKAIEKAPKEDAALAHVYNELGGMLLIAGDFAGAAQAYETVLKHDAENLETLNNLAYLYAEELNDGAKALPHAEAALAIMAKTRSKDPSLLDTAAWVYFKVGNAAKAEELLNESLLAPGGDTAGTNLHLAHVLTASQRYDDAQRRLQRARELKPDSKTLEQIERLNDDIRNKRNAGG